MLLAFTDSFSFLPLLPCTGTWAWNWMEPPLGQISFFLLCLSFARAQISNLGVQPYTAKLKTLRADKIVRKFPQYDEALLTDYSKSVNFY